MMARRWLWLWLLLTGISVAAVSGATSPPGVLEPGMRVKAKGARVAGAVLEATSLRSKDPRDRDLELEGEVEALDPDSGRFRVLGVWIEADESELDRRGWRLSRELARGDWVRVEGAFDPEGRLIADRLERREPAQPSVEGRIDAVAATADGVELELGPLRVRVGRETELRGFEAGGAR